MSSSIELGNRPQPIGVADVAQSSSLTSAAEPAVATFNNSIYQSTIRPHPDQQQAVAEECCCITAMQFLCRWVVKIFTLGFCDISFVKQADEPLIPSYDRAALNVINTLRQRGIETLRVAQAFVIPGDETAAMSLVRELAENPRMQISSAIGVNTLASVLLYLMQNRHLSSSECTVNYKICGKFSTIEAFARIGALDQNQFSEDGVEGLRAIVLSMGNFERNLLMAFAFLIGELTTDNSETNSISLDELMTMAGIGEALLIPIRKGFGSVLPKTDGLTADEISGLMLRRRNEPIGPLFYSHYETAEQALDRANLACKGLQLLIENREALFDLAENTTLPTPEDQNA